MRSTGSAGGEPGSEQEATSTDGGILASVTPGRAQNRSNQISGFNEREILFFAASIAISHAVMGETKIARSGLLGSVKASEAGLRIGSPCAIQITAQVSSSNTGLSDYRAESHSTSTGSVRSIPGLIVTVPSNAP